MKDSLPNMNDDELDKLFREAAEEHDAAGNGEISSGRKEEAWEKLQEKLDAPPPEFKEENAAKNRNTWKLLLLLFLLIITGIFFRHFTTRKTVISSSSPTNTNQLSSQTNTDKSERKVVQGANINITHAATLTAPVRANSNVAFAMEGKVKNNQPLKSSQGIQQPLLTFMLAPVSYIPKIADNMIEMSNMQLPETTDLLVSFQYNHESLNPVKAGISTTSTSSMHPENKSLNVKIPHWYLGLSMGPEWSSASGEGWGTGVDGGLSVGYRLNKKWTFETGIFAGKKIYTALPYNYNPLDNSWRNYNVESINANCLLLEMPLNVDYTIWSNTKHFIYAGAGLSSTLMHHEAYTYNIKTNTGYTTYQEEMYNKERQLFSLLNVSAGYERTWSHFSFGAAPYVKIPLTGIGYGRVKLFSTGIQFTLKYGFK